MASTPGQLAARTVRTWRTNRHWSQQVLASRLQILGLNWTRERLASFEAERRADLTLSEALLLSQALGVRLPDLLAGPEPTIALGVPADLTQGQHIEIPSQKARAVLAGAEPGPSITKGGSVLRQDPEPYSEAERGFGRQLGLFPSEVKALAADLWQGRSVEEEEARRFQEGDPRSSTTYLYAELAERLWKLAG